MVENGGGQGIALELPASLAEALGLLVCPGCGGRLASSVGRVVCVNCARRYPVSDGILELAPPDGADPSPAGSTTERDPSILERSLSEVITLCERRVVRRLLATQGPLQTMLDLSSGGGRLAPVLGSQTRLLIEADTSRGMLERARRTCRLESEPAFLTVPGRSIPLRDGAVDAVVCCRPWGAMPSPDTSHLLIAELLRVARRFAAVGVFGRRPSSALLGRGPERWDGIVQRQSGLADLAELARSHGAYLVTAPSLLPVLSSRRIALLAKTAPVTLERSRRPLWRLSWRATG